MNPPRPDSPQRHRRPEEEHGFDLEFLRAVVISGNPERRQRLREGLSALGFEITEYVRGAEAIPQIRRRPPATLVLCDDLQGTPDALGILKWLAHQDFRDRVYRLVLCHTLDEERTRRLLQAGACDVTALAFTPRTLEERLQLAEHRRASLVEGGTAARRLERSLAQYRHVLRRWPDAVLLCPSLTSPITDVSNRASDLLGLPHHEMVGTRLSLLLPALFERAELQQDRHGFKEAYHFSEVGYHGPRGEALLDVSVEEIEGGDSPAIMVTLRVSASETATEADGAGDADDPSGPSRPQTSTSQAPGDTPFAAQVAHAFNNILTVISGNLALLYRAEGGRLEGSLPLLQSSLQSCQRASALAKRLTRRKLSPLGEPAPFEVVPLLEALRRGSVLSPGTRIEVKQLPSLWPARGHRETLLEALGELIRNADEAAPNNLIELEACNEVVEPPAGGGSGLAPGPFVALRIRDHGPGISAEVAAGIFQPFFTTRAASAGLGLSEARQAVESEGGSLELVPAALTQGRGACFLLRWPACPPPGTSLEEGEKPAEVRRGLARPVGVTAGREGSRPRALFLDDEPDIRTIVHKILSVHGFDVTCTATGEEAIEAYYRSVEEQRPFDVLLLDLDVVGGMGGREAIAILRQDFPHIRAVVTTGYLEDAVLQNHREHGFSGVLTKPFQMEDLVAVLRTLAH